MASTKRKAAPKSKSKQKAKSKPTSKPKAKPKPKKPAKKPAKKSGPSPAAIAAADARSHAEVTAEVIDLFRACYPPLDGKDEVSSAILAANPTSFPIDPTPFYTVLESRFGVSDLAGTADSIASLVTVITNRWDGKLR